jgi:hypothetical protein
LVEVLSVRWRLIFANTTILRRDAKEIAAKAGGLRETALGVIPFRWR